MEFVYRIRLAFQFTKHEAVKVCFWDSHLYSVCEAHSLRAFVCSISFFVVCFPILRLFWLSVSCGPLCNMESCVFACVYECVCVCVCLCLYDWAYYHRNVSWSMFRQSVRFIKQVLELREYIPKKNERKKTAHTANYQIEIDSW